MYVVRNALISLKKNKVRTFLTSLGVCIGVFSVVILVAFGVGLKVFVEDQFNSLGSNIVVIFPGKLLDDRGRFRDTEGGFSAKFDINDVNSLARISSVAIVSPGTTRATRVTGENGVTKNSDFLLTTASQFELRNLEIKYGRLFRESDVDKQAKVAVMGSKIAEEIFGSAQLAIGKSIRAENLRFEIIGVLDSKGTGSFGGPDFDAYVYVPYSGAKALNPSGKFLVIYLQAKSENLIAQMKEETENLLLRKYNEDDFSLVEQTQVLETVQSIFGVINTILVALASISLIVGGVGIMNIMYATVNERVKEIGIRRAIGARKEDIIVQFITESIVVSLVGGIIGLVLAMVVSIIANRFVPVRVDLFTVSIAMGVSCMVGLIFGVFPARKAAALTPIEAIRK